MMKSKTLFISLILLSIISINLIQASISDVKFPVAELGNCNSQSECEIYCDDSSHMGPCLDFAETYGLMSSDELAEARKIMPLMKTGETPGGCKNKNECDAYCDNDANFNVCIEFAKKAGLISDEDYEMAKKTGGKGPGGCKRDECKTFCDKEENFDVCIEFAKENGLIPPEEYEIAKKTGGKGPGGCKGKEECDVYCDNDANFLTCIEFGKEHGIISEEEYQKAKKSGSNKGPGGCKSEEECNTYCQSHMEECKKWGEEHGLEFDQKDEGGRSGPGGCQGEEECKAFCNNPDNTQICMEFSIEEGKMGQGELDKYMQDREKANRDGGMECASQCEERPGEMLTGTNMIDGKCECYYKPIEQQGDYPQGDYPRGDYPGGGGGCTQPGPEGQCNPGPGAGPGLGGEGGSGGSGDGSSGGSSGGSEGGSSDSGSSGGGDSSAPSSGDSGGGGESAPVTGGIISEGNSNDNWLMKILDWIFGV